MLNIQSSSPTPSFLRPVLCGPKHLARAIPVTSLTTTTACETPERQWVDALRRREPAAVEKLYRKYKPRVTAVLVNTAGGDDELADLVQETFAQILRSLPGFRGDHECLSAWVTRIAVFTGRRRIRSRRRRWWLRPSDAAEGLEPFDPHADPRVACALRRAEALLSRLPEGERQAFQTRVIDGMSLQEAANACAVSLATIKRRLERARASFQRHVDADPFLRELATP